MGLIPYGLALGVFGVVLPPLLFSIGMPHVGFGLGTIFHLMFQPAACLCTIIPFVQGTGEGG
ncbi:hypothetical protein PbDSM24746_19690 [Paenibacillus macerans]|nr:hypothetical protein PbDSM24746_19690 [Paenibacillus macerans]GBK68273.1 hypothetical protein PbJCM17693_19810 [Paenibacillus macerans]